MEISPTLLRLIKTEDEFIATVLHEMGHYDLMFNHSGYRELSLGEQEILADDSAIAKYPPAACALYDLSRRLMQAYPMDLHKPRIAHLEARCGHNP